MTTVHDFHASLALSHRYEEAPWWTQVYEKAFPTLLTAASVRQDGWAQRGGIDRVLVLGCGRQITIDEKVREKDYGDVLLEYYSDEARKTPGWVRKPLACEFIAYAIAPSAVCYLFPTLILQRAWRENIATWWPAALARKDGFDVKRAQNKGYVTASLAVPTDRLLSAMSDAIAIRWA